jgi:hypothetical protein
MATAHPEKVVLDTYAFVGGIEPRAAGLDP